MGYKLKVVPDLGAVSAITNRAGRCAARSTRAKAAARSG